MSGAIPKPRSPEFQALRARLSQTLGEALSSLVLGALERSRAERFLSRFAQRRQIALGAREREALAADVARACASSDDAAFELFRELDRAAQVERNLIASMPERDVEQRFGKPELARFRRHGAKLVWALARDERDAVRAVAHRIAADYHTYVSRLSAAEAAARDKGAEAEIETFLTVYRDATQQLQVLEAEMSQAERDRARLAAEVGRREAELKLEAERRKELAERLARLEGAATRPVVLSPMEHEASRSGSSSEAKLRKLHKRLEHLERENAALGELRRRVQELEEDNERLRRTVTALRAARASEQPPAPAPLPASTPMVEPPRRKPSEQRPGPAGGQARVGVFLDVANLAGAARRLYGRAIDYQQLLAQVLGPRSLAEARAYVIDKEQPGFDAFTAALRRAGYKVFSKKPKTFADGTVKADWDVGITADVLTACAKLDLVVLGSGDGDFRPLVAALQQRGVRVEVASFPERTAAELRQSADHVLELDEGVLES